MSTSVADLRTLSIRAYVCLFGAFLGYLLFGGQTYDADTHITSSGLFLVWVLMGLIGAALVALKDRRIAPGQWRTLVIATDAAVTLVLLLLATFLPTSLGLLRPLVVLTVAAGYLTYHSRLLDAGKLAAPEE